MNFFIDTHTHTIASGHAYNTVNEMIRAASDKGIQVLAITDHAPSMPGSCNEIYFSNMRVMPGEKYGVKVLYGSELNIIDYDGNIDLPVYILKRLDIVIASMHTLCVEPGTVEQNTNAYIKAMDNPYVNIIGHPDDARYPVDYERLVIAAKEKHKLLELNNASLCGKGPRKGAFDNDITMLTLCKKHGVYISIGSDAHCEESIGDFSMAQQVIEAVDFPEKLIVNSDFELLKTFLKK
ncbi:MAG: phosphatase [Lachnospiraceae bacterium]